MDESFVERHKGGRISGKGIVRKMRILVTGGAGYIGSHTCVELLNEGHEVVILDNLYNSSAKAIDRVREISGKDLTFVKGDILDRECLDTIFESQKIDAVIHFAGLKAVGESVHKPVEYYSNNITGTLTLVKSMDQISSLMIG